MKRIVNLLMILSIVGVSVFALIPEPISAMTGSGTAEDPYMIYDINDLQDIGLNLSAYYELANDIDASGFSFIPIGNNTSPFVGTLDGKHYKITGLNVTTYNDIAATFIEYNVGLITNLGLEDVHMWGIMDGVYLGAASSGLVWLNFGTISNCYVTGLVEALSALGGAGARAGGLVGEQYGTIVNCCCAAVVSATSADSDAFAGGFAFAAYDGSIDQCFAIGYTTAYASGWGAAGGFISGGVWETISNCYARGDALAVGASETVGGFIGYSSSGTLSNCYSTGATNTGEGGFVGYDEGATFPGCLWDIQTSGTAVSDGGTGKTTTQMKTESTFTDAGWDFDTIWAISSFYNDGYPCFLWQQFWLGDFYQVVWFQPNTIIEGTTLPNRTGEVDGEFHWGTNPAGVSVVLSPFYSDYAPANITLPEDIITPPQDMIGPTGNPGNTRDVGTLATNPFYPLVKAFSDNTGIPVQLWWIILASLIVLIVMVVTYWKLPHLMITALAGGSLSAFFYAMGIYPFWVPLIFAVMALAIILGERSPTV